MSEDLFNTILNSKGIYKFNEKQIIRKSSKKYFLFIPLSFLIKELKVEIPLSQRSKVEERVDYFESYLEEEYKKTKEIPDLNVLSLGFYKSSFYIIDGQHRYTALKNFFEKNKKVMKDYYVMTVTYLIDNKKGFKQIMHQINNNFISEEYLFTITEDDDEEELMEDKRNAVIQYMEKNYKIYLSEKLNCRPPFINISIFMEYLFNLYPKCSTYKLLMNIEKINKELEEEYKREDLEFYNRIQQLVGEKKEIKPFFLGKVLYEEAKIKSETLKIGRIKFGKAVRKKLWSYYFKSELYEGECMNCGQHGLKMSEYDISHIQSIKNGGSNEIHNLIILCSTCNKSIGGSNIYEHPQVCKKDIEDRIERILKKRNEEEEVTTPTKKKIPVKKEGSVLVL